MYGGVSSPPYSIQPIRDYGHKRLFGGIHSGRIAVGTTPATSEYGGDASN